MDTVYIVTKSCESVSKTIFIMRKYRKNTSMGDIREAIEKGNPLLECDYLSLPGIKRIAKCYDELTQAGIVCEIYDEDEEQISRDILENQIQSYMQTEAEIQAQIDDESEE